MKAAIYARKSSDDNDKNEENKSVTRQVDRAKAYATANNWSVDEEHVFVDDGISGADFKKRQGLLRMLNRLKEFDVIVMSELSRLGREQWKTAGALANIAANNVKVYFYLTNEELKFETAIDKFLINAYAYAAEQEREKIGQRSRDALERKAAKGHNAGGAVFGYDLAPVYAAGVNGERTRSHTDYKINEEQAAALRGIFQMYVDGHGHTAIAWTLNGNAEFADKLIRYFGGRAYSSPRQGKRGSGSWAPSSIRSMLYNPRYIGKVPYGKYSNGKRQEQYLLTDRPDLRIIDQALWDRAQTRLREVASNYIRDGGHWWGRPSTEKYLLSGLCRCAECQKNITIVGGYNGGPNQRSRIFYYGCSYQHTRGPTVCSNTHRVRVERLDEAVAEAFDQQVLVPDAALYVIETAMLKAMERLKQNPERPREIEVELRRLRRELKNLNNAIAGGKAPKSLLAEITARETRLEILEREQAELAELPRGLTDMDRARLRKAMQARMGRLKDLLHDNVPRARQVLQKMLVGPLSYKPAMVEGRKTFALEGKTLIGPLVDPELYKGMASPRGLPAYISTLEVPIKLVA